MQDEHSQSPSVSVSLRQSPSVSVSLRQSPSVSVSLRQSGDALRVAAGEVKR
jgi:hypothetical protein